MAEEEPRFMFDEGKDEEAIDVVEAEADGHVVDVVEGEVFDVLDEDEDDGGPSPEGVVQALGPPVSGGIAGMFPDLDLAALATFVPPIELKRNLEAKAKAAMNLEVKGAEGLRVADELRSDLKAEVVSIERLFDGPSKDEPGPAKLLGQLHRRLTGLRGDFVEKGKNAILWLNGEMVREQRRLKAAEREEQRKAQQEADRQAKEVAARAAAQAKEAEAPPEVVERMEKQAETAKAPPVPARKAAPPLRKTTVVARWRARMAGTGEGDDPRPQPTSMTPGQVKEFRKYLAAAAEGDPAAPLGAINLNWGYLNSRAGDDKSTFAVPGFVAEDEGGTRSR